MYEVQTDFEPIRSRPSCSDKSHSWIWFYLLYIGQENLNETTASSRWSKDVSVQNCSEYINSES